MNYTILDCYTDEPAGLGVPPYLGTYPRYIYGLLKQKGAENVDYITIDDLRLLKNKRLISKNDEKKKNERKTDIRVYNLTRNYQRIDQILNQTEKLIIILGVHVPGKYLSAIPGTLREVKELTYDLKCKKILTGPCVFGTQLEGGKFSEEADNRSFDEINPYNINFNDLKEISVIGAEVMDQIGQLRIIEIETGHGCKFGKCSFCTEPIKNKEEHRQPEDIILEINKFYDMGARYFRLGKQTCFYSFPDPIHLLRGIREDCPGIKVLHIDNVNPIFVSSPKGIDITKAIVQYCTPGNIAAFGIESFDMEVIKQNSLNCKPEIALDAIKSINKYGSSRSNNGMPHYLPGLNLIFGLLGESRKTHEINMQYLKRILNENLLLRRINIRQAAIFKGTELYSASKNRYLFKNKKYYWKWRKEIRVGIDNEMLKKLVPIGTILRDVRMEIYDGNTTFGRQIGTYALITGIKKRLELNKFYDIEVKGHMLRSIIGEPIKN